MADAMTTVVSKITTLERRVTTLESIRPGQVDALSGVNSLFTTLPGLVGYWPMSSVQRSTGNAYDLSGQGRTLTYNGNPTYNIYNNIVPYLDCDGTGDYLSRADETDLDVLGSEATNAAAVRGLTLGGWFWVDANPAANANLIGKGVPGASFAYSLWVYSVGPDSFIFWANGASIGAASIARSLGAWQFVVGRFIPSTSVTIFNNGTSSTSTSSIPASISNTADALSIMNTIDGRTSLCFLCANALPDSLINSLFARTRPLFGV